MRELPHAPGFTLTADAFMAPGELVGFSLANQPATVFSHFHDFYELAFVLRGTGRHLTEAGSRPIRRGHAIFVVPGVSHGYEHGHDLVVSNVFLRVEAARFDLSWAHHDPRLGRLFAPGGVEANEPTVVELGEAELLECLGHVDAIRQRPSADRGEAFELGHLLLILDALARRAEQARSDRAEPLASAPSLVGTAAGLIERDLQHHWTLDALAGELAVDPFHLTRLCRRWLGEPPIAYANRLRAQRAAALLASTDDPVATVGAEVGWPDPTHFSRRFRHAHGISPRGYRARLRAQRDPQRRPPEDPDAWAPPAADPTG